MILFLSVGGVFPEAQAADLSSKAGVVATSGGNLNIRSSPSSASAKVSILSNGSYVMLTGRSGSWWQVEYGAGKYGYCHENYIRTVSGTPVTVSTQSGSLNVRSGPATGYSRLGTLSRGETVIRLSESSGWSRILYHGTKIGYVSSQYLGSGNRYPAIALWLRDFKQTDYRWKDVVIASSGKTFAQIGCATTAIAMLEGHRTGKLIYPDDMAKQLRYTASGSVYWPSHYTTVTSDSNLLSGIYNRLQQGKPVLYGAINTHGSQHWVIITGYTGGSTLTTSGFTIHDPGSRSRTNLQQFQTEYPNFYKYFYY